MSAPVHLTGFAIKGYKAFAEEASIRLAPLTIVLGRNNAGKSALCNAPIFFTHPFEPKVKVPFPLKHQGIDFCTSLMGACFARQLSGFTGTLLIGGSGPSKVVIGGAAISEKNQRQVITALSIEHPNRPLELRGVLDWGKAQKHLAEYPELSTLPSEISALTGLRPPIQRVYPHLGSIPRGIGCSGEDAVQYLAVAKTEGRSEPFEAINEWFETLGVQIDVELHGEMFEVTASRPGGPKVNLADAGAGIAQILPLVVALRVVPEPDLPRLFIIEQPELDLHPYAHARAAELLVGAVTKYKNLRLLVETHSDALVLRVRREIAATRMTPDDVQLYFVEENRDPGRGSIVKAIQLDDRGTPSWWPRGVFAESQAEFHEIRRELAKRDRSA
jgi:hypothetical protein